MIKKVFKWIGFALAGLIGFVVLALIGLTVSANNRINKTYDVTPAAITIPTDAEALQRGEYLFRTSCAGCHGDDLAGTRFFDDPTLGYIPAPNLTTGQGGIGGTYTDTDFVRAIRHGIDSGGKPLMIMPSSAYWYFSDEDLGAVIAYVKSAAPVDNDWGEKALKPMGRILLAVGALGDVFAAEGLDHSGPRPAASARDVTAEYGAYLVNTSDCRACHGETLTGGKSTEPGAPFSPNLTPGGVLASWSAAEFIETLRTGLTPYGRQLDANFMPYEEYSRMTDDDLTAMFLYLQSLPAMDTGAK